MGVDDFHVSAETTQWCGEEQVSAPVTKEEEKKPCEYCDGMEKGFGKGLRIVRLAPGRYSLEHVRGGFRNAIRIKKCLFCGRSLDREVNAG